MTNNNLMAAASTALSKTTTANVVAGAIIIGAIVHAVYRGDTEMLKYLAFTAVGYLFGVTAK